MLFRITFCYTGNVQKNEMHMRKPVVFLVLILNLFSGAILSQDSSYSSINEGYGSAAKEFSFFSDDELLQVSVNFELARYMKKKLKGEPFNGSMTIHYNLTDSLSNKIKIKPRGEFRRQYCSFPPIEITFDKPVNAYSSGSGFKKVKLVTHCNKGRISDDYVLREYLVYKLYNIVTDTSFKVRLSRIRYIDSGNKTGELLQYGFFIEPADIISKRINAVRLKDIKLTQKHIIPGIVTRLAIFNYMIGNYDWAVPNQHNTMIFKSLNHKTENLAIAVPYDFDFTGLVNTHYAVPAENTGLNSIRERLFTGICRSREMFRTELLNMAKYKTRMMEEISDFEYLSSKSKIDISSYLESFFSQIENERNLERLIDTLEESCKEI